jgi:phosphoribosyl-ATP pyrophosphohydrolase/phosphoribosyl-AMP cyclohydrolase
MLGFMNEQAYDKTLTEKKVTFYSRTKQRLWTKGETSGNYLLLTEIKVDCDKDTLLVKAIPTGPVCHTGTATCFNEPNALTSVQWLEGIIEERKNNPTHTSYTSTLFEAGSKKIAQKVGEEAVELILESTTGNSPAFLEEAADLLFHYLVLLQSRGYKLEDVQQVLLARNKAKA